jgi:nitric oxide reductase subunit B
MTKDTIQGGQAVFQKYALMDYGTVLGNGSYMGPDYTDEALKFYTEGMQNFYAMQEDVNSFTELTVDKQAVIRDKVTTELRENRYNDDTDTLVFTDAQVYGVEQVRAFYRIVFTEGDGWAFPANLIQEDHMPETGRKWVAEGDQITQISDFFFWKAWLSSTERPGETFSYTNNWPYYEDAGNVLTYSTGFFGMEWIVDLLPFSIAKGAHLQLAIFWIATAWLGVCPSTNY